MKKILVILGPTATGKTDIALKMAKIFNGELIACDSRQVYKGLDIGTGKAPSGNSQLSIPNFQKNSGFWEIEGIKVWMYDVADPRLQYSVYDYIRDVSKIVRENNREKLPIIVGGTGLYLKGLLEGFDQSQIPGNPSLRRSLQETSINGLQEKLMDLSPTVWENLNQSDRNNPRRLIRKIELVSMYPYIVQKSDIGNLMSDHDVLKIGLTAPRPFLYSRIDSRLDSRINQGLISEAKLLLESGVTLERMRQLGLEYGCLADLLERIITEAEFVQKLKNKIHQYAKRQLTWFKKESDVQWFDISEPEISHRVETAVRNWYNGGNHGKQKN